MKKLFLILLPVLFIASCGSSSDDLYIPTTSITPPPNIQDNTQDYNNITTATYLKVGNNDISAYSENGYIALLSNIPQNARNYEDNDNYSRASFTLKSYGRPPTSPKINATNKILNSNSPVCDKLGGYFHIEKQQKAYELLNAGLEQATPKKIKGLLAKAPASPRIGDIWSDVYIEISERTINAKLIAISEHAYFYIETDLIEPTSAELEDYKRNFEQIYQTNNRIYGHEGDVDGNGKVIIMLADLPREAGAFIAGYFYAADKYPKTRIPQSNEADILYISLYLLSQSPADVYATMAHEFQHMINFNNSYTKHANTPMALWIDEGLSMQAEIYNGYYKTQNSDYVADFLSNYNRRSLIIWDDANPTNYGYAVLFTQYLVKRFGDIIVEKLYNSNYNGVYSVEDATNMGFNDVFKDFTLTLLKSAYRESDAGEYLSYFDWDAPRYASAFSIASTHDKTAGQNDSGSIRPYSFSVSSFSGNVNRLILEDDSNSIQGFGMPKD